MGEEDDDVDPEQKEAGKYWRLQVHWPATAQSSLSCIKFDPIDAHSVGLQTAQLDLRTCTDLPFPPHPFIEGIYKCLRLYRSDAFVHLWDFARGVCDGKGAHYEYGRSPRKPRVVALGRRGMGHASRSARGQVETKSVSALGSENRVCERESDKPTAHIDVVEQSSAQVSSHMFSVTFHNDLR